jgi:hypothetical protein
MTERTERAQTMMLLVIGFGFVLAGAVLDAATRGRGPKPTGFERESPERAWRGQPDV